MKRNNRYEIGRMLPLLATIPHSTQREELCGGVHEYTLASYTHMLTYLYTKVRLHVLYMSAGWCWVDIDKAGRGLAHPIIPTSPTTGGTGHHQPQLLLMVISRMWFGGRFGSYRPGSPHHSYYQRLVIKYKILSGSNMQIPLPESLHHLNTIHQ